MRSTRRGFVIQIMAVSAAAASSVSYAQAGAHVEETDEQAVALGYRVDTARVDASKYPKHQNDQRCGNCSFFQGKADDAWGGCAMFGRKQVAHGGWCTAWVKVPG